MIFTRSHTQTVTTPRCAPTLEGIGPDAVPCALKETRVTAGVTGFVAEVRVEQVYQNPAAHNMNARYTFPLPHDAAVCAFEFTVAGKVIHGEVREKAAARAAFVKARADGQRAALMEQDRPNVFTLELANVPAGAEVRAVVTYLEALPYRSGEFCLRIPTVVAPRYTPGGATPNHEAHVSGPVAHTFSFDLTVNAGMPVESWHCKTHALETVPASADQLRFRLANDRANRDLVFGYRVGGAGIRLGLVTHRPDATQDGSFYLFAVPPADVASSDVRGKELIFLLDRSGSMEGPKMVQAREALKACLRALNPADAFSIYAFDDKSEAFAEAPVPFTQVSLEAAERWLSHVGARGGTEILPSLKQALAVPADRRQRVIVVITDGQVSNESELIAHVRQHIGAARLYTVGVDTAVNGHLLTKLATMGKGSSQFVLPTGDIEGAIAGLCQRFGSPLLTDPVADFGNVRVSDLTPNPLPDVMAGQVVAVAGRYRGQGQTDVVFSGQGPGRLLEHRVEVTFPKEDQTHPVVDKIWARMMIDRHEDALLDDPSSPTVKQKIVALAIQHGLLSSQTSFLAIDERDGDPALAREAIEHVVPQEMPASWDMQAPMGGYAGGLSMRAAKACAAPAPLAAMECLTFGDLDDGPAAPLACLYEDLSDEFQEEEPAPQTRGKDASDPLRELAKQQRADGSWNGSVDDTADALLAFVAAGHTDRTGSYTAQIRRAIEYIDRALTEGWSGSHAKLLQAITALAAATGSAQHQALEARLHA